MMEGMHSISTNDTSGSSTASSVLINATSGPRGTGKQHDTSGSSFSSTNSQRVRIKAKYLKEIKSPFDAAEDASKSADAPYIPPVLPGNRPKGYQESNQKAGGQRQHHDKRNASIQNGRRAVNGKQLQNTSSVLVEPEKNDNASSELLEAVNTSGQSTKDADVYSESKGHHSAVFQTLAASSSCRVKQGAPVSGMERMSSQWATANGTNNELRITQFAPTGRQRVMKEQLLKRHSGPVKRFVQPKMVSSYSSMPANQEETKRSKETMDSTTSVAAAAVAATAPIVKVQSDLEHKMNTIMEKLSSLEESRHRAPADAIESQGYMHELQNKLEEVTQLRLKQLERMQEQQMEWQAKLMSAQPFQQNQQAPMVYPVQHVANPIQSVTSRNIPQTGPVLDGQPTQSPAAGYPIMQTPVSQRQGRALAHGKPVSPRVHNHPNVRQRSNHARTDHPLGSNIHVTSKRSPHQAPSKTKKHVRYTPAVTIHTQQSPQGSSPGSAIWKEKDPPVVGMEHGTQTSPLDTPAPRRYAPVPLSQNPPRMSHLGRGLLEEILTSHDEEEKENRRGGTIQRASGLTPDGRQGSELIGNRHQTPIDVGSHSATRQADRIVKELSNIRRGVDHAILKQASPISSSTIHGGMPRNPPTTTTSAASVPATNHHEQLLQDAEREIERRRRKVLTEPAPLDDYLRKPEPVEFTSPPSVQLHHPLSPSQYNAPIPTSSCTEAEALLKKVQTNKAYLETNLDIIARATTEEELYNLVEHLYQDENSKEKARIRKEVDNRIAAIQHEIQQELLVLKAAGSHRGPTKLPAEKDGGPTGNKPKSERWRASKKKTIQARINTGLKRGQKAEEEETKPNTGQGKENVPKKQPQMTRARKPPASTYYHNKDERYINRVYGKAVYQAQRRTLKTGPYLRYATEHTPKKTPNRPVPVVHTRGVEVKSSKTQTKETSIHVPTSLPPAAPNQYFFDPYPSSSHQTGASVAPTHGQLIPMAIPLGEPRVGAGLAQPVTITVGGPEQGVSVPMGSPRQNATAGGPQEGAGVPKGSPRQKAANVAVVNVVSEKRPKLEIEHLPQVNIDTAPPTPSPSEEEPPPTSPPQDMSTPIASKPAQEESQLSSYLDVDVEVEPQDPLQPAAESNDKQFSNYLNVEDKEQESSSEDELPEPGISLPGYRGSPKRNYHGPVFPPKAPPANPGPSSDVLAAGMKRKDVLENQAVQWIEQELMARMISELNSRQEPRHESRQQHRPTSPDSSIMSSASSQPSMVEAYGPAGLQLFVDAGQPVNSDLVDNLVKEVLEEKIASMLGQRQSGPTRPISVEPEKRETSPEPTFVNRSPIATPEVTPKASPIHTPPSADSPIATPVASIAESSVAESEPESPKEPEPEPPPREATPAPLPVPTSPVTTPATTPPPTPPKAPTPELSLRESPIPLLLDETDLPTPAATPEVVSPEPEPEPEKIEETPPRSPTPPPVAEPTPRPPSQPSPPPPPVESSETETEEESPDVTTASQSETVGREISEGEWLISKSEGQVDLIQDVLAAKEMKLFETGSSADSTMRGAEDIERDLQEPPSEGEILPSSFKKFNLADDPVVALLTRLGEQPQLTPHFRTPMPRTGQDNGARSPGEVSLGQRPSLTPSTERFVIGQLQPGNGEEGFNEVRAIRRQLSPGELGDETRRKTSEDSTTNNQPVEDSTFRLSHLARTKNQSSNPTILVGNQVGDQSNTRQENAEAEEPKPEERSESSKPAVRPRVIKVAAPRVIQVGARVPDGDDKDEEEEEPDEERGAVGGVRRSLDVSGMTPVEDLLTDQRGDGATRRQPMPPGGVFGTQTMSDLGGTRTITPDAINIDALLQSGYLSQTFSQSEPGTSDFERTGEGLQGLATGGALTLSQSGELGMTSGATPFNMTEDSLEFPKKMKAEKGPRTFSVTLPSAQAVQDVGDSSEGDGVQVDTISDVSEISAGEL